MNNLFVLVLCFVSTVVLAAVVIEEPQDLCSEQEFRCSDGNCINLNSFCDGRRDCDDGTDETTCFPGGSLYGLGRAKRQASSRCNKNQWRCRDGSCIAFDGKCDGVVDCPDGSDETFPLCRNSHCQTNWFRCTYGACVDGTAPCNGVQDCADNSDELLPTCRNEVTEVRGQFKCKSGELISAALHCDGVAHCSDASDEAVAACAGKRCANYLFTCAYGACVDRGSDCNGIIECHDGSDESDELCNRTTSVTQSPLTSTVTPTKDGACVLPQYPAHGRYNVQGVPNAAPGQAFDTVVLNITCNPGYDILGKKESIFCLGGSWSGDVVDCVRFCQLNKHVSVEYQCLLSGDAEGFRECNEYEPTGTVVRPVCKTPDYYYSGILSYMRCIDGNWDYTARCVPGLTKNGTNITILIKDDDKYEVYVGTFQYTDGLNNTRVVTPVIPAVVTPVTPDDVDYDIDEEDWRMLNSNTVGRPNLGVNPNNNRFNQNTRNNNGNRKPNGDKRRPPDFSNSNQNTRLVTGSNNGNVNTVKLGSVGKIAIPNTLSISANGPNERPGVHFNIRDSQVNIMTNEKVELNYKDKITFRN